MAFNPKISNLALVKIAGTFADKAGILQPFDFHLICRRLVGTELQEWLKDSADIDKKMLPLIEDWDKVIDDDRNKIPYTPDGMQAIFDLPGMPVIILNKYLADVGAKAKN